MTTSSQTLKSLGLKLLVILSLNLCSTIKTNPDEPSSLLNQVCSQTNTPDFCISSLGSYPEAATANLNVLAHISLEQSLSSAVDNNAQISAMLKNTTDPGVKLGLSHCTVNYSGSIYALENQLASLDLSKYKEVGELSGIASENTRDCERPFVQGPTHSSPLTSMNEKLEKLSDISDVIIGLVLRSI